DRDQGRQVRSLRQRRRDERVAAEGHERRGLPAAARDHAARRPPRGGSELEKEKESRARPQEGGERREGAGDEGREGAREEEGLAQEGEGRDRRGVIRRSRRVRAASCLQSSI